MFSNTRVWRPIAGIAIGLVLGAATLFGSWYLVYKVLGGNSAVEATPVPSATASPTLDTSPTPSATASPSLTASPTD